MQTIKRCCLRAALLSICVMLMLVCSYAYADESVQVHIPVIATGADCSVELLDSNYHRVQWLDLKQGVPNSFTVTCNGLMRFTYHALVLNKDTSMVKYDRTVYTIHVDVFMNGQGEPAYFITIENPANPSSKLDMIRFNNTSLLPVLTPTPKPTVTPEVTIKPTATPAPYDYRFTFTKKWSGDHEESIDWVMYNPDGTIRKKLFNKHVINDFRWEYEAWFTDNVDDCYVIEIPPEGYIVMYQNVGEYADVTDRCHNGGTIINYKAPQTGDKDGMISSIVLFMTSALLLGVRLVRRIRARGKA